MGISLELVHESHSRAVRGTVKGVSLSYIIGAGHRDAALGLDKSLFVYIHWLDWVRDRIGSFLLFVKTKTKREKKDGLKKAARGQAEGDLCLYGI
jgi:hypothetical protein